MDRFRLHALCHLLLAVILISVLLSKIAYVVWLCLMLRLVWDLGSGLHGVNTQKVFSLFFGCFPHRLSLGLSPGLVLVQHRTGGFPLSILSSPGLYVHSLAPPACFSGPLVRNRKFSQNSNHQHCHTIPRHWAYPWSKASKHQKTKKKKICPTLVTPRGSFPSSFLPRVGFLRLFSQRHWNCKQTGAALQQG